MGRPSTTSSLRQTTDPHPAVCRVRRRGNRVTEGRIDGETVVVGGHLDLAGRDVPHRLVDAAMAISQLVGAEAESPPGIWLPKQMPKNGSRAASTARSTPTS